MALRLLEAVIPAAGADEVDELLAVAHPLSVWKGPVSEGVVVVRALAQARQIEAAMDALDRRFGNQEGFRVLLFALEATLPRPPAADAEPATAESEQPAADVPLRISREELYNDVIEGSNLTRLFTAMVVLSTVVAAVGLLRSQVAIIIGAMVIAPLLGPNMALSLGVTLGDTALMRRALRTSAAGIGLAFVLSIALGVALTVDPSTPEIAARTNVDIGDIFLALAAGAAGALALTTGAPASLVGVMVAVALLPPLVVLGLLLAGDYRHLAPGAALLVFTNVVCLNLAGVATFLAQGVGPRRWWEASRARRATRIALALWGVLLAGLVAAILLAQR